MENKCIYYKTNELTYKKCEHVVPAGLGGSITLPKGYVSDQANEYFSKLELIALRTTLVAGLRNYIGPAHRGRMTPHPKNNPLIQMFKLNKEHSYIEPKEMQFKMGFTLNKTSYLLPQILFSFDNNLRIRNIILSGGTYDLKETNTILKSIDNNKLDFSSFISIKTAHKIDFLIFVIGTYYNKKYVYSNIPFVTIKQLIDIINSQSWNNKMINSVIGGKYDFSYTLDGGIRDNSLYFLLAKTSYNVLAYRKGQSFVLSHFFDDLRNRIISNDALCLVKEFDNHKIGKWIIEKGKDESHIIVIGKQGNEIISYISFYGELIYKVIMATKFEENFSPFAFVSHWHDKKDECYDLTGIY